MLATTLMTPRYIYVIRNLHNTMTHVEHDTLIAIEWFNSNYMKLN